MENAVPLEVIGAPFTLWRAPVGTEFPDVDAEPGAGWTKVGTSGPLSMFPEGVTLDQPQSINVFRSAGHTGPRKVFRTEEDQRIRLTLADLSLEQYSLALNGNTVETVAAGVGTPGTKTIGLSRGPSVATYALLLRGPSPYMEDGVAQFEVPKASQTGSPAPVFRNGEPAGLALEFTTIVDETASSAQEYFGRLVAQTDEAES
jgi:hypothetical protein